MENTKNGKTVNKALMMGAALVSLNALSVSEARAVTGTGAMSAVILTAISIAAPTNLRFGDLTVDATTPGTAPMLTTGAIPVVTGGVSFITGSAVSEGVLSISGVTGVNIDLVMAATSFTVTNGTATMTVNNFNLAVVAGGTAETVTLPASPTTFPVGATLNVGAAQAVGTYTGNYSLTAVYQ